MKVVCFSEIQWRYVRTRKQQILSRFPAEWEILFLSSVVAGKRNNFRPEKDGRITHVCVPVFKNFPQKPLRILFSFPPARFIWNVVLYLWVRIILVKTGFTTRERVFFVSNIYYAAILPLLPRSFMLYDCNDDPLEFPNAPGWAGKYFRKLSLMADLVTAVSRGLVKRLEDTGVAEIRHVGNGVDYELFKSAIEEGIPGEMKEFRRPVLGYSGAIAEWFDIKLLDMIAEAYPQASIVLFGPVYGKRKEELSALKRERGNIFYIGSKPYEKLGAYIASLDVCLIPLKMNELMRMADPNKLYEYAAAEKPVVTYRFAPEMDELSEMIYLADTREEFVRKIGIALEMGSDPVKLGEFARRCSWQARADEIAAIITAGKESKEKERKHEE